MKNTNQKFYPSRFLKYFLAIAILVSIFEGCKKDSDESLNVSPDQSQNTYRILTTPTYKGVYIDSFDWIIGDTAMENPLLRWCKKESLNAISLYDTKALLLKSSNFPKLAKFIKKARTQYGIKQVAAVRSLGSQFTGSTSTYNKSRIDTMERFNVFNLENEYWNAGATNTFGDWYKNLNTMYTTAHAASPKITSEFYFGWFQNPSNKEITQAAKMVSTTDRILLHDYWSSPNFSYIQSRLAFLGQEALKQNKIIDIVVLFSIEQTFAYDYFDAMGQNHSFADAYNSIITQHNATTFTGKDNIRIIGYQLFCQSWARRARPL
ncbi:MAG: hypothetical protein IPP32_10125 [Bacteroidetes bacterium]|nr:hypothetical protein [Bacteroidota bacterium]